MNVDIEKRFSFIKSVGDVVSKEALHSMQFHVRFFYFDVQL